MVEWIKRNSAPAPAEVEGKDFTDSYFVGLDLAQTQDFSALVAVRKRQWRYHHHREDVYTVRGIKRWPLRTSYVQIAADVVELTSKKPLAGSTFGVDETGVGKAVVDIIVNAKPKALLVPVLITGGVQVTRVGRGWHVPKKELCGTTNKLLQTEQLDIPMELGKDAETLGKELKNFRAKIAANGHESLEADWRSRQHDDIVLALAIAVWLGEKVPQRETRAPVPANLPGWR